jgi:hypothetical protein
MSINPLSRFLQFTSFFSGNETNASTFNPLDYNYWRSVVSASFSPTSMIKIQMKAAQSEDTRSFDLDSSLLARFFLVTFQSGVSDVKFVLPSPEIVYSASGSVLDAPNTCMIFSYESSLVNLDGHLRVHYDQNLNIHLLEWQEKSFSEFVHRDVLFSKTLEMVSVPESPVNVIYTCIILGIRNI